MRSTRSALEPISTARTPHGHFERLSGIAAWSRPNLVERQSQAFLMAPSQQPIFRWSYAYHSRRTTPGFPAVEDAVPFSPQNGISAPGHPTFTSGNDVGLDTCPESTYFDPSAPKRRLSALLATPTHTFKIAPGVVEKATCWAARSVADPTRMVISRADDLRVHSINTIWKR